MSTLSEAPAVDRVELDRRRGELQDLQNALTEQELALSTVRHELRVFESGYNRVVCPLHTELEQLKSSIKEFAANFDSPSSEKLRLEAESSEAWAENQSEDTVNDEDLDALLAEAPTFAPNDSIKKLFREAAKRFHPDLGTDPKDLDNRHLWMAKLNAAYLIMDEEKIKSLMEDWELSLPPEEQAESARRQLSRILKQTGQVRHRLLQIQKSLELLRQTDMARLLDFCQRGEKEGRDVLQEMADEAEDKIHSLKSRVARLASDCTLI